jgi:MFS transporter, DHA1 family, tetracycline resistance protein
MDRSCPRQQMIRQTAESMWLLAFNGDTAAYALVRGQLESATAMISFLVTPLVAGLSDAVGRRTLMIVSTFAIFGANTLPLFAPAQGAQRTTVLLLGARQMLYRIAIDLGQLVRQSSLGDMFAGDNAALAEATALDQALFPACKIVAPLIGGALVLRGLRLPWYLSCTSMLLQVLVSFRIAETLPPEKRLPWRWQKSNPLSFFELFRRGRTMSILGAMTMLARVGETGGQPLPAEQICNLHKAKILEWDVLDRSRYESVNSIFRVMGLKLIAPAMRLLGGSRGCMALTLSVYCVQTAWLGYASKAWQFWLVMPTFALKLLQTQTLQSVVVNEGSKAGFGQAQMRGMVDNLQQVVTIASPLFWSNVYAWGVRRGTDGAFYWVVCAMSLAQLLLSRGLPADIDD